MQPALAKLASGSAAPQEALAVPDPAPSPVVADVGASKHAGSETGATTQAGSSSTRLLSLDALRGFDMFWLLGGEQIVHGLCAGAGARTLAWGLKL